jgi:hypothetical protein
MIRERVAQSLCLSDYGLLIVARCKSRRVSKTEKLCATRFRLGMG